MGSTSLWKVTAGDCAATATPAAIPPATTAARRNGVVIVSLQERTSLTNDTRRSGSTQVWTLLMVFGRPCPRRGAPDLLLHAGDLLAWRLAPRRGVFDLGVDCRADDDREPEEIEPQQQKHDAADGAVRRFVVPDVHGVEPEDERAEHPQRRRDQRPGRDPHPLLPGVGREAVDDPDADGDEREGDRPLRDLPRRHEHGAQAE